RYEGQSADNPAQRPRVEHRIVSESFFDVTGQRLLDGRRLLPSDDASPQAAMVAVVNQALVRRDFPDGKVLGKRFDVDGDQLATIVGVVSDVKNFGPFQPPQPEVYFDYRQSSGNTTYPLVVRWKTPGEVRNGIAAVREAVRSVDPQAAVFAARPMEEVIASS